MGGGGSGMDARNKILKNHLFRLNKFLQTAPGITESDFPITMTLWLKKIAKNVRENPIQECN